jgi:hypothetical protein
MTVTQRDIEKLKAIGYTVVAVSDEPNSGQTLYQVRRRGLNYSGWGGQVSEDAGWAACKVDAQSPWGAIATMTDKIRWLCRQVGPRGSAVVSIISVFGDDAKWNAALDQPAIDGTSDSPASAVDVLFWRVP